MPGEMDKVADQARVLREWFRGFVRRQMGRPLTPEASPRNAPLTRFLSVTKCSSCVAVHQDTLRQLFGTETTRRWRSPEFLLLPIGEALALCVCDEDFSNIRACEGQRCTLIFADHTRRRVRRWCSMAMCGNRAKQAAHRHRRKTNR